MKPTRRAALWGILLVLPAAALAAALWPRVRGRADGAAGKAAPAAEVWTCSMHPQVRLPGPGQCPICGMKLIPAARPAARPAPPAAAAAPAPAAPATDPGVETEAVGYRALEREIRTVGKLDYSERQVATISARVAGRVDRLYADFTGVQVRRGDHLAEIYSPSLYTAQTELLVALAAFERGQQGPGGLAREFNQGNLESARTKLLLWGLTKEQVAEVERSRKTQVYLTIFAPIGGTVIGKEVREGQYVKEGDLLYRIADPDPIWLYLDVYEYDLSWVRYGQAVDVSVEAYPGETFRGTVTFIEPFLDDKTRSVKVRVNLKNPDRRLKPAMYASAVVRVRLRGDGRPEPTGVEGKYWCPMHPEVVKDQAGNCPVCGMTLERVPEPRPAGNVAQGGGSHEGHGGHEGHGTEGPKEGVLAVPASAVLDTGRRKLVYRERPGGGFEPVDVELGPRAEARDANGPTAGFFPVLKGLKPGDRVAVRGGFLIDSERQIEGASSLLYPQGQSAANLHAGHGGAIAPQTPAPAPAPAAGSGHRH